jgi:hypothetical protein
MEKTFARVVVVVGLLVSTVASQTVWTVSTPDGIQPAIAAASPGDILVLVNRGGFPDYSGFDLNKGLTIRGNNSRIGSSPGIPNSRNTITINVPPGQAAHLERLDLSYSYSPYGTIGSHVIVAGGRVTFEDCGVSCGTRTPLAVTNALVTVVRGNFTATGYLYAAPGIAATNSQLTIRDASVSGGSAACNPPVCSIPTNASPGVTLMGSTLHAERTAFVGGSHYQATFTGNGEPAIVATNSSVWLADCRLGGGSSNSGAGGTALVNNGTTPVQMCQTILTGGTPGGGTSTGPVNPTVKLLRLALSPAWTRGMPSTLTFQGDATAPYSLWLATDNGPSLVPPVAEPVWVLSGTLLAVGLLNAQGVATITIPVPTDPWLEHVTVWFQGIGGLLFPLHASTIAGGVIR